MTRRTIWCDHCGAHMPINGILSCLRKSCQTKDRVPPRAEEGPPVTHYDSSKDKLFGCVITYQTPAGRWVQVNEMVIAPSAEEALALAEKLVRRDKRRTIGSIKYRKAYEQ